jgi:hypothetical protein
MTPAKKNSRLSVEQKAAIQNLAAHRRRTGKKRVSAP